MTRIAHWTGRGLYLGHGPGRGAWCCDGPQCVGALRAASLARALRRPVDEAQLAAVVAGLTASTTREM